MSTARPSLRPTRKSALSFLSLTILTLFICTTNSRADSQAEPATFTGQPPVVKQTPGGHTKLAGSGEQVRGQSTDKLAPQQQQRTSLAGVGPERGPSFSTAQPGDGPASAAPGTSPFRVATDNGWPPSTPQPDKPTQQQQSQKQSFNHNECTDEESLIDAPHDYVTDASSTDAVSPQSPLSVPTNSTKVHSSASSVHPLLIYSIRYEIRSFDLQNLQSRVAANLAGNREQSHHISKQAKTLIAGLKNTIGLDFYYSDTGSYLFWTDVIEERIYRGTLINGTITDIDVIVQSGLATAEGLAVDWIGQNIYWVESTLDHIEVANMNGTFRRTLLAGEMESPRAIAVDPRYGLLFWTDWDKKSPRIERATMAGEDRETIVHIKEVEGGWPNGLTLDYDTLKIYWIDANSDSIHVVDYHGKNHQAILKDIKSLGHPFSITLFENNLYWTDWKTNSVSMANKHNGSEARELQRLTNRLFDIKVFHPDRQPRIDDLLNPCYINKGNCSHLCLLSVNNTRRCECPHLMRLASDERTCETDENVLLIGRNNEIRAVDIRQPLHHIMAPISVPKVFNPKQFEFDAKSRSIFWADFQTNEVKRAQLAGTNIETIIDVIIESPSGLALDWISGNIYVTSAAQQKTPGKIFISNLNGEYISVLMDSSQAIISPKSLAVHPVLGLLFCVDENERSEAIIFAAGMDGKHKRIIASKQNNPRLENPSNLAIDYDQNKLYWINQAVAPSDNASIQYYDILQDRIVTIYDEAEVQPNQKLNPGVLCVDGDHLIISGRIPTEAIIRVSKDNPTDRTIYRTQNLDQISALRVFNASSQVGTNACSKNNGGCSQLCVPTNSTHRTCKCTMGYNNNPNTETECDGKDLFLIFSYNLGMKGISLEPNTSPYDSEHYLPPIHKAFRASSIDYMHRDNLIYWVDNEEGSITRINRDTTNYQIIVQGLESEESIAIDWVAGNIYWLDPYYDIIEVARLNGSNRYVIVSGDMDKANGIVVNPLKGYIVWSDIGSFPKIETAKLDGSERRIIVSKSLSHVDDLAIDYAEDFIYWVDSTLAIIERIKEDGTGRKTIYSSDLNSDYHNHLVSIATYKNYLFIADSVQHQGSIIRCDKNNASNREILQQNLGDGIRDITVFAPQPIPSFEVNPCVENNGGCQDLCLFLGEKGKKRCICSHGKLKSDGLTCKPYDTFILFSKLSHIESLHITEDESFNNSPYPPISIENRSSIISLTVDYNAQRVIYSDIARDQISSSFFNGTDRRVLVEKQSLVEGIAFANDQLYWTSISDNSISKLNTTSRGYCNQRPCPAAPIEKIVLLRQEDKPRGIAVDSCTNYIYWTNWNTNACIQRASPQNSYKVESIITTDIKVPNGIAIDHKQRKLYWCDAKLDKIETCDMDGSNRIILISASPQHPFALAIWDNYVFWTDWLARGVFKADKYSGQSLAQIKKVVQRPMGIAVAAPETLDCPSGECSVNNGGCPDGWTCIQHAQDTKDHPSIECRQNVEMLHEVQLPTPKCLHSKTGCQRMSYHDILMDSMDRYNLTDWYLPSGVKSLLPSYEEGSKVNLSLANSNGSAAPDAASLKPDLSGPIANKTSPTIKSKIIDSVVEMSKNASARPSNSTSTPNSAYSPVKISSSLNSQTITKPEVEVTIGHKVNMSSSSSSATTLPPAVAVAPITVTTKKVSQPPKAAIQPNWAKSTPQRPYQPTVAATAPATTIATIAPQSTLPNQSPLVSNATSLPCQANSASPQASTDCTGNGDCKNQFKCYLSDKLVCIPMDRRCDGNHDCPSKEDENDCYLSKRSSYSLKQETNWHRFVPVILIILGAAVAAMFLVFGTRGRRRWFVGGNGAFNHRRMFDDNGTNIEISNPMFDEDDSGNLVHCAFSIDLNERTTNFSNPLYERQVLLMNDKPISKG